MKIGCFALIQPFASMRRQFELIRQMGFDYADVTDNHDGASLGVEYGFTASFSLDSHPSVILDIAKEYGITLTSVCAHANLLDPVSPDRYGTFEIIKAIKLAHWLGVKQVVTTEGDPKTVFGKALNKEESFLLIREKLYEPVRWAEQLGIELLLEPHGPVTGTVEGMGRIVDELGAQSTVGGSDRGGVRRRLRKRCQETRDNPAVPDDDRARASRREVPESLHRRSRSACSERADQRGIGCAAPGEGAWLGGDPAVSRYRRRGATRDPGARTALRRLRHDGTAQRARGV